MWPQLSHLLYHLIRNLRRPRHTGSVRPRLCAPCRNARDSQEPSCPAELMLSGRFPWPTCGPPALISTQDPILSAHGQTETEPASSNELVSVPCSMVPQHSKLSALRAMLSTCTPNAQACSGAFLSLPSNLPSCQTCRRRRAIWSHRARMGKPPGNGPLPATPTSVQFTV